MLALKFYGLFKMLSEGELMVKVTQRLAASTSPLLVWTNFLPGDLTLKKAC